MDDKEKKRKEQIQSFLDDYAMGVIKTDVTSNFTDSEEFHEAMKKVAEEINVADEKANRRVVYHTSEPDKANGGRPTPGTWKNLHDDLVMSEMLKKGNSLHEQMLSTFNPPETDANMNSKRDFLKELPDGAVKELYAHLGYSPADHITNQQMINQLVNHGDAEIQNAYNSTVRVKIERGQKRTFISNLDSEVIYTVADRLSTARYDKDASLEDISTMLVEEFTLSNLTRVVEAYDYEFYEGNDVYDKFLKRRTREEIEMLLNMAGSTYEPVLDTNEQLRDDLLGYDYKFIYNLYCQLNIANYE